MKYITTRILKKLKISQVYRREQFDCIFKLETVECRDRFGNYIQLLFCYNDTELFGKALKLLGEGYDLYDYESVLTYGAKTYETFEELKENSIDIQGVKALSGLLMENVEILNDRIKGLNTEYINIVEVKTFLNPVAICVVYIEILGIAIKPMKIFLNGKTFIDATEYPLRFRGILRRFVKRLTEEVGDVKWIGENF